MARATNYSVPKSGYESCKCISKSPVLDTNIPNNLTNGKMGLNESEIISYGVGCDTHDMRTRDCNTLKEIPEDCQYLYPLPAVCTPDEIPEWCSKMWCYINETECNIQNSKSIIFPNTYFSYGSCGETDLFSSNSLDGALQDKVMNVAYRINSAGWKGSYHRTADRKNQVPMARDDQWYGLMPQLVEKFEESSGAIINMTEAPLWVYDVANYSSDFTNCAHAVSLGMLDFCTGMFTITTERAKMTTFATIETTPLYLVVKKDEETHISEKIFLVFKPFTLTAWACTLLVLLASSFILFWQESVPGGKYDPTNRSVTERRFLSRLTNSAYDGILSFFGGFVGDLAETWEGRGTALGIGFFVLLILSMYTANLTTILVSETNKASLTGIDDAIVKRVRMCIRDSALSLVEDLYPKALWHEIDGRKALIEAISKGEKCKGGVLYLEDLESLQANGDFCNLISVGLPIVNSYRGIPLNPIKSKVLLYHFQKLINDGVWDDLMQKGVQSQCPTDFNDNAEDVDSMQFDVIDLAGVFVICAIITAVFGTLSAIRWKGKWGARKIDELIEESSTAEHAADQETRSDEEGIYVE